ncbi:hypothetical protein [Mucilaginibacter sp.]|jgi:hypothetical protein|uniref:hypothetical protein n=1 Tax=Mucilaginibacter sp. TaxID=1882438 RepID=UPI002CF3A557|nr:hypothetical protein [Mucilaginibacter sp.]HTI61255.1 hypothetical protein [Mucilaginibacter sp.]
MKSHTKSSTNKLVDRFDNELRALLLNDLNSIRGFKEKFIHSNPRARAQVRLSVA